MIIFFNEDVIKIWSFKCYESIEVIKKICDLKEDPDEYPTILVFEIDLLLFL